MALSFGDMKVGTVVEHYWKVDPKTGDTEHRNPIRRGVIERVVEDPVMRVFVRFKRDGKAEEISGAELNRVHGPTRDSLKIVRPTEDNPTDLMERDNHAAHGRFEIEDELGLGPRKKGAPVD